MNRSTAAAAPPTAAALFVLTLVGCASETVRPAMVGLPAAYEAPAAAPGGQPGAVALDRWWTLYDDPQLTGLVDAALDGAPDAKSAKARLREALGERAGALTGYGPQGDITGQVASSRSRQLSGSVVSIPGLPPGAGFSGQSDSRTASAALNVSWELDLFGRRRAARQSADADLAAARFDAAAARASLAANVADSLFAARGLAIQLEDARETARITRTLAAIARARFEQGLVASSDADQAQADAAQAEAQADDLQGQLQATRRSLLILVGRGTDPLAGLEVPASVGVPPAVPAAVPGELLARRPDVREAAERLRSETGTLKLDELALLPTVKLIPNADVSKLEQTGFSSATAAWSIGAGLLTPLLSRPKLMGQIHAQGAKAELAVIAYEKAVQTAFGESENALAQLAEERARTRVLTQGEAQARRAYDATRGRYEAGLDDITAALTAERTWRGARSALTGAQVQAMRRSVTAFKALGGGWSPAPPNASSKSLAAL